MGVVKWGWNIENPMPVAQDKINELFCIVIQNRHLHMHMTNRVKMRRTVGLERTGASLTANVFLLFASLVDYIFATLTIGKSLQASYFPDLRLSDFSLKSARQWLVCTLPGAVFAFLLASLVPSFTSLVGLLTSITIVLMNTAIPSALWLAMQQRVGSSAATGAPSRDVGSSSTMVRALWGALVIGSLLSVFVFAGTIKMVSELDFSSGFCRDT